MTRPPTLPSRDLNPGPLSYEASALLTELTRPDAYKEEWHDSVSVNEIDSASVVKEMIDVRDGPVKCAIFNIDDVEFIINDLSIN